VTRLAWFLATYWFGIAVAYAIRRNLGPWWRELGWAAGMCVVLGAADAAVLALAGAL
jgi:hypothetical protein